MKLNVLFLVLLLITSIKSNNYLDPFSIEGFKDHLKDKGLFEIIKYIKYNYGQDVAIISCEELNKNYNGNCKKLVTEYMEEKPENINEGTYRLLAEFYKNSENSDEDSIASSKSEIRDEKIIAFSQSEDGSSKSHDSMDQYDKLPIKPIRQLLYNGRIMKYSKIRKMHDTLKKIFNPIKLISIKTRIRIRVLKLLFFNFKKEFLKFLDSLFGIRIKILN